MSPVGIGATWVAPPPTPWLHPVSPFRLISPEPQSFHLRLGSKAHLSGTWEDLGTLEAPRGLDRAHHLAVSHKRTPQGPGRGEVPDIS